uniref:Uncharacterized protein n=1 Tax=Anopheles atroparvus TaxID=41427 RepID=A0AAG5D1B0_ANOAO
SNIYTFIPPLKTQALGLGKSRAFLYGSRAFLGRSSSKKSGNCSFPLGGIACKTPCICFTRASGLGKSRAFLYGSRAFLGRSSSQKIRQLQLCE